MNAADSFENRGLTSPAARKYRNVPLNAASYHECIDGSGYPHGLAGSEIPFMAKNLSVADVFEAVTADRHYRKGMSVEQVFAIVDQGSGTRFDPVVVAALKRSWGKSLDSRSCQ